MSMAAENWAGLGSAIASLMFLWAVVRQYFPSHLDVYLSTYTSKLVGLVYPYIEITFAEYTGERLKRSEAYTAIEAYLGASSSDRAKRLKAETDRDGAQLVLSMDDYEEVTDDFQGVRVWWTSSKTALQARSISFYPAPDDRRFYRLTFHRRHRKIIHGTYLHHVMEKGKAIGVGNRQRKLYTNSSNYDWYEYKKRVWSHVPFEHPATFDTLAMEPDRKQDIIQDLLAFRESKEYYARIGKPWKRGYLLYGPPGTGKSSMIAAMANLLDYDVYDLELTAVKNNTALRKLLIETTSKSIIVLEDIDCSLDLSGKRKSEAPSERGSEEDKEKVMTGKDKEESKVTLSGLLNFIDGLWSACGGERLIVFTTNHVDKLDPALIRRGRMDKHIELSYCSFEGFEVLARNYLGVGEHPLFESIRGLMEEKQITPADVAENLMRKTVGRDAKENVEACLQSLVQALKECGSKNEVETAAATETQEAKVDEG
ncbi:AAA-ATPase ASD, mitochondrial [Elaeis guineensis]|uniref:AAA-ATPase ASD, mitochondrial n=1 Tax=Elaeis guineensis var. tenera TaxID=51953 RepID=A0A6I9QBP1_ELAGV|nr:AAA-ATPase ASD, mitochondrial [Elaeis guineensis]